MRIIDEKITYGYDTAEEGLQHAEEIKKEGWSVESMLDMRGFIDDDKQPYWATYKKENK